MSNFNKVKNFMETFGQEVKTKPSFGTLILPMLSNSFLNFID